MSERQPFAETRKTLMNNLNEAIINHAFFRGMKPEHLTVLAERAKEVPFECLRDFGRVLDKRH